MLVTKLKSKDFLLGAVLLMTIGWFILCSTVGWLKEQTGGNDPSSVFLDAVSSIYTEEVLADDKLADVSFENISSAQVQQYREYYGDLGTQLGDIFTQYIDKIDAAENQKKVEALKKERDEKMQAIIANYSDADIVREKIVQEETKWLEANREALLTYLSDIVASADRDYSYYVMRENGEVITNVSQLATETDQKMIAAYFEKETIQPGTQKDYMVDFQYSEIGSSDAHSYLFAGMNEAVTVSYGLKRTSPLLNLVKKEKRLKSIMQVLACAGLGLMILGSLCAYGYVKADDGAPHKGLDKLKKIPLDVLVLVMLVVSFLSLGLFEGVILYRVFLSWAGIVQIMLAAALFGAALMLCLIQLKELLTALQHNKWPLVLKAKFNDTFFMRCWKIIRYYYRKLPFVIVAALVLLSLVLVMSFAPDLLLNSRLVLVGLCVLGMILLYVHRQYYVRSMQLLSQPAVILSQHGEALSPDDGMNGVADNLAKLGQMVEQTKQLNRKSEHLKSELLTNVSHDLRTPLTSLITYSELLNQPAHSEGEKEKYRKIIHEKSLRMKRLIDDLFEVTKMDNGEITLNQSPVNMNQLLEQAVAEYEDIFKEKNLKMMYYKPHEKIEALVDGDKIWRVMDNLFSNAAKYAMSGTRIHLKLYQEGQDILLEMKNIANYELNQEASGLVERFKRADNSRHTEGSGLGLAIASSIVELHHGQLTVTVDGDMFKLHVSLPQGL